MLKTHDLTIKVYLTKTLFVDWLDGVQHNLSSKLDGMFIVSQGLAITKGLLAPVGLISQISYKKYTIILLPVTPHPLSS